MNILYGAHLSRRTILKGVAETGAEVAQVFLGSPRRWAAPPQLPTVELDFWAEYEIPIYVHSSYLVNPASSDATVRKNSVLSLSSQFAAAAAIKAEGVVVHAGHAAGETISDAVNNWQESLKQIDTRGVQLLIENTAGGNVAPGRTLSGLDQLWSGLAEYSPKLCFDTCHAWTGKMLDKKLPPEEAFLKLLAELDALGVEIGLTHLNGSLDARGSGRDHHSNLTNSAFPLRTSKLIAKTIGAHAILETPGPLDTLRKELFFLRNR